MNFKTTAAAIALACAGGAVHASTISVSSFSAGSYNTALAGAGAVVSENFESFTEATVADGFATSVGTFSTVGGVGSGGTVKFSDVTNDGTTLAVRDANVYGRSSTTSALTGDAADDQFLDSNDTFGINWSASLGGQLFNQIILTVRDAAEFGGTMLITVDGVTQSYQGAGNADTRIVQISFLNAVTASEISFANVNAQGNFNNDGFSIDDIAISAVPLPASALMLLAGVAGLGAVGRRRKSA